MRKIGLIILLYFAAMSSVSAATRPWAHERDPGLGFDFKYPRDLFQRTEGDGKPSFHYFVSRDAEAKLMVGAWNNEAGQTPSEFKAVAAGEYRRLRCNDLCAARAHLVRHQRLPRRRHLL